MADQTVTGKLVVTDKIGIGIGEPIAQLHLSSADPSRVFLESGGSLLKVSVDGTNAAIGTDAGTGIPLALQTDGTNRLTITSGGITTIMGPLTVQNTLTINGNVGIGTAASATAKLQVSGVIAATSFQGDASGLTGLQIPPSSIANVQLADNAVTAAKIQDGSVGQAELAVNSVVEAKLASSAVTTAKLADVAVTTPKLANGSVTEVKLVDSAVTALKLAAAAVMTDKLADDAVTTAKLAAGAVTLDKLDAAARPAGSQWVSGEGNTISYTAGKVGIGTNSPHAQLTLSESLGFTNATTPMMYVFQSGWANPERPIIAHSPPFPDWGLAYRDTDDTMLFRGNGAPVMAVNLSGQTVGVGIDVPNDKLDVAGTLRVLTGSNPIRFTAGWSSFPDSANNQSEISNDIGTYKTLMIVGNRSAGLGRRVSIWDRLEVNGRMSVSEGVIQKGGNPITATADLGLYSQAPGYWMRFVTSNAPGGDAGFWFFSDGGAGNSPIMELRGTTGNLWIRGTLRQGSSRTLKENIADLSVHEAAAALRELNPVRFSYKADTQKETHLGFIAEDVPELVSSRDRQSLSAMDIVAVLTRVVQEQQHTITELAEKVRLLETNFHSK